MGITGLLPYLEQATRQCHISEFRKSTVAIDSYCLLHKGANACAEQLARGEDSTLYVDYCMKYVKMLLSYDIHPIMVFDGKNLPAKAKTEAKRRESRKNAKQRAAQLLSLGKLEEARTYLKQCIDVTPKMAHNLIRACQKLKVDCIVAPYESDAQMAFFNMKGVAECVITEDSDLVLFGCKKVLYKLDLAGSGRLVESDKISIAMKMRPDQFTFDKFRFMCILSGCDYVSSLNGIGLKKAEKFIKLTAESNPEIFLDRIPRYLNMKYLEITDEYKRNVLIANATFLHQVVFDPYKKKLVHLIDPEIINTNPEYLVNAGEKFDNEKAYQVAIGNLNPYNFEQFNDWIPSDLSKYSIWAGFCKKRMSSKTDKLIQKSRLQEFVQKKNPKIQSIEVMEKVQIIEEETCINEDLLKYATGSRADIREEPILEHTDPEEESKSNTVSPVIYKNPFLKRKRISKFPKTFYYGNDVVKSRYFCSETSFEPETIRPKNDFESENNSDVGKEEVAFVDELFKKVDSSQIERLSNDETILKSCENSNDIAVKVSCGERQTAIERALFVNDGSREGFTDQHDSKRRKLGPCRRVGLKKTSITQKTLHSFFTNLRKAD
ncbi:exonuclease 1 [Euwallacea fornicatus]|uniref:exonuclease 1 n=1 Tax=Euwallacea fornicatus TaxID=995702 RepID=UPI00338FD470